MITDVIEDLFVKKRCEKSNGGSCGRRDYGKICGKFKSAQLGALIF